MTPQQKFEEHTAKIKADYEKVRAAKKIVRSKSRRERIATQLMAGMLANPNVIAANPRSGWGLVNATERVLADIVIEYADALMEALDADK